MKRSIIQLLALLFLSMPLLAQTVVEGAPGGDSGSGSAFTGGTLSSPLLLSEDPTQPAEAVTLRYLNSVLGSINTTLPNVVLNTGGTMTGDLTLKDGSVAASQAYVQAHVVAGPAGPAGPTGPSGGVTTPATANLLKGTGSANGVTGATPGTDYVVPSGNISGTSAGLSGNPVVNVSNENKVIKVETEAGSTADVKLAACLAALPTGGTCDARGFGATTQTIASPVLIGAVPQTVIFDPATTFVPATTSTTMLNLGIFAKVNGFSANTAGVSGYSVPVILINTNVYPPFQTGSTAVSLTLENTTINGLASVAPTAGSACMEMVATNGASQSVVFTNTRDFQCSNEYYGLEFHASGNGFINGNNFSDIVLNNNSYAVYMNSTSTTAGEAISGNKFTNVQVEMNGVGVLGGVYILGSGLSGYNFFNNLEVWDNGSLNAVSIQGGAHGNTFSGHYGPLVDTSTDLTTNSFAFGSQIISGSLTAGFLSPSQLVETSSSKELISTTALPNGVTATTQTGGDNSTKIATDAFVAAAVSGLGGGGGASTPVTSNVLKGNGLANGVTAATPGTDYVIPNGNITGTAGGLSGTPALPSGTTATTQSGTDSSTKIATDSFVQNILASYVPVGGGSLNTGAVLTLGDGYPAASEGYVASAIASSGGVGGGGGTTTTTNQQLDQKTTSASSWNKICTATGALSGTVACGGVSGNPIAVNVSTKGTSPVLNTVGVTGAVATYGLTVNSSANTQILVPTTVGTNYAATVFKREMWFTGGSNLGGVDNFETDTYMFDEPDQWEFMMGWQCNRHNTGFWQYDNFKGGWTNTSVPCSIVAGHTYHYVLMMHRDLASSTACAGKSGTGDSSITHGPCEHWDTFKLEDLTASTSQTYTLNVTYVAEPASLGSWQTWTGIGSQVQLDVVDSATGGANTPVSMIVDDDSLTTYVPVTSTGGGSTSTIETVGNLGEYDFEGSSPTSGLTATGTPTIDTTNAYSGANATLFNSASEYYTSAISPSASPFYARFELNLQTLGTGNLRLLELDNGSTQIGNLYLDQTTHFLTFNDSANTVQTVCASSALSLNAYHRIELAWVEGSSGGSYQALIDGTQTCSITSTNTGTSPVTQVKFGENGAGTGYVFDMDNVGFSSTSLLGAVTLGGSTGGTPLYDLFGTSAALQQSLGAGAFFPVNGTDQILVVTSGLPATAGLNLCTDSAGGATTSGCPSGGSGGASTPATTNLLKGNSSANSVVAATPGTDYVVPSGNITGNAATATNLAAAVALPNGTAATTQTAGDNTTKLATTGFVTTAISGISGGGASTPVTTSLLKGNGSLNGVAAATPGTDYNIPQAGIFNYADYASSGSHTQYDMARQAADAYATANPTTGSLLLLPAGVIQTCDAVVLPVSSSGYGTTSIIGAGVNETSIQKKTGCTAGAATFSHADATGPLSRGIYRGFTVDANHIDTAACNTYGMQLTTFDHVACGNAALGGDHEWEMGNTDASNVGWMDNIYGYNIQTFDTVGGGKGGILTPVWSGTSLSSLTLTNAGTKNYSQYVHAALIGPGVALCTTVPTLTAAITNTTTVTYPNIGVVNYGPLSGATVATAGNCSTAAQTAGIYVLTQDGNLPTYGFKMTNNADSHYYDMEATGSFSFADYWSSHSSNNNITGEHPYTNATVAVYDAGPGNRHTNAELDGIGQYGFEILAQNGVIENPTFLWDSSTSYIGATAYYFANSGPSYQDYQVHGTTCTSATPNFVLATFLTSSVPAGVHLDNSSTCVGTTGHLDKYAYQNSMSREGVNLYTDTINSANEIQHSATNTGVAIPRIDTWINNFVPTSLATEQASPIQRLETDCYVSGAAGTMQYSLQLVPQTGTSGQAALVDSYGGNCSFVRFANYNQFQGAGNGIYFGNLNSFNAGIRGDGTTSDLHLRANGSDTLSISSADGDPYTTNAWYGDVSAAHLLAVGTPTLANVGTAGSTSYTYAVTGVTVDGGETLIGTTAATATGNATLSGTNYNTVKVPFVRGAFAYNVYRHANGGGLTNGLIGTITYAQQASNTLLSDTGQTATTAEPTVDTTGALAIRNGNAGTLSYFSRFRQPTTLTATQDIKIGTTASGWITPDNAETVSYSATPTFSSTATSSYMSLTGNVTSFTLASGPYDGFSKTLVLCQDATGGRTVTAPSNVHGFMNVGLTASTCSVGEYIYVAATSLWYAKGAPVVNQ